MFTKHWNNTELLVKEQLKNEDFILCKNHEDLNYQVLKKDPINNKTDSVLETYNLEECMSLLS